MNPIIDIISTVIIIFGLAFMFVGVIGVFKFKNFYPRMLVTSKVDTVGALTVSIGIALRHGFSFFSAKVILIMVILLLLSPLVAHIVTRSAYTSGMPLEKREKNKEGDK